MKIRAGVVLGALALAAADRSAGAAGPAAAPLADHVPGDAVVFFSWAGAEQLQGAYAGSNLKGFVDASTLRAFFSTTLPQIIGEKTGSPEAVALAEAQATAMVLPYWNHPMALYVGPLDFSKDPHNPTPRLALLCEAGKDAGRLNAALQNVVQMAGTNAPVKITVAANETLVVLAVGEDANGYLNANAHSLAAAPAYVHAVGAQGSFVPATPALTGYIDVHGILANIDEGLEKNPNDPPPEGRAAYNAVIDLLNLRPMTQVAFTAGFDGKEWAQSGFVGVPASAPRTGLLRLIDPPALDAAALASVPKEAIAATVTTVDAAGLLHDIRAALPKIDAQAAREADENFARATQELGVDPDKGVLSTLDGLIVAYETGGAGLPYAVKIKLKDAATFSASLKVLTAKGQAAAGDQYKVQEETTAKGTISTLALPVLTLGWTVHDGWFYVSTAAGLDAALTYADAKPAQPALTDNPLFAGMRKAYPAKLSSIGYSEPAPLYAQLYQAFKGLGITAKAMAGVDIPEDLLPTPEAAKAFFSPTIAVAWSDAEGIHTAGRSAFPGAALIGGQGATTTVAVGALTAGMLLPSLGHARELSNRAADAANERGITQSCVIWAADHNDKLPDDLSQLLLSGQVPAQMLVSRRAGTEPLTDEAVQDFVKKDPADLSKAVEAHTDFVYIGKGVGNDSDSNIVILYEKPNPKSTDGMNVAFEDAHAEFFRWASLAEAFKPTNEYRKAHNLPEVDVDSLIPAEKRPAAAP